MTATDTEAMSALHKLLDERQRYQGWLATLEGRRSSTPPHVYERVQRDYVGRLDQVMQSLAEQAGQLSGTIEAKTTELATLRRHESDRTDERHEAELRAAVGEFTPDDWEQRRAEADSDIERIATERHSLEAELEELERIVALTRSIELETPTADAAGGSSASASASTSANAPRSSAGERAAPAKSVPSIDDFVAEGHPPQERPPQGSAAAPMSGNPGSSAGADDGIANGVTGVEAVVPTRTPPLAQPLAPAALGDSRRDTDKTLKCPECGAMNYATEWYCERCGGELSTF